MAVKHYIETLLELDGVAPLVTDPPPANSTTLHSRPNSCNFQDNSSIAHNPDTHPVGYGQLNFWL